MNCPKCNGELVEIKGNLFCSSCGSKIEKEDIKEESSQNQSKEEEKKIEKETQPQETESSEPQKPEENISSSSSESQASEAQTPTPGPQKPEENVSAPSPASQAPTPKPQGSEESTSNPIPQTQTPSSEPQPSVNLVPGKQPPKPKKSIWFWVILIITILLIASGSVFIVKNFVLKNNGDQKSQSEKNEEIEKASNWSWEKIAVWRDLTSDDDWHCPLDIKIDPQGNPHVAWSQCVMSNVDYSIFYAKWGGAKWGESQRISKRISGEHDDDSARCPQMQFDSRDNIHMVWQHYFTRNLGTPDPQGWISVETQSDIFYSKFDGKTWSEPQNISKNWGDSSQPELLIDSKDHLHVIWNDFYSSNLFYAKRDGNGWSEPKNISDFPDESYLIGSYQILLDSKDSPHIVYGASKDDEKGNIYYTKWDSTTWTTPIIIEPDTFAFKCKLDSLDNLHIIWEDFVGTYSDVFYTKWDETTLSDPMNISNSPKKEARGVQQIGLDSKDNIYIVWVDRETISWEAYIYKIFYAKWDGVTLSNPINVGRESNSRIYPNFQLDPEGNFYVIWYDAEDHYIYKNKIE